MNLLLFFMQCTHLAPGLVKVRDQKLEGCAANINNRYLSWIQSASLY